MIDFKKVEDAKTDRRDIYEAEIVQEGAGTSQWAMVPAGVTDIGFDVIPNGAATFRIEGTGESRERVEKNLASGVAWTPGDVTDRTIQAASGFTAFRLVVTSGNVTAYLRGI